MKERQRVNFSIATVEGVEYYFQSIENEMSTWNCVESKIIF